jgi:hypothetical protein
MPRDKFLDLMITFEALISAPEGESDSVNHKLALRRNAEDAKYLVVSCRLNFENLTVQTRFEGIDAIEKGGYKTTLY